LRVNEEAKQETSKKQAVSRTLKMEAYVPPKHQLPFTGLHCILDQNVQFFTVTAMRISNPTIKFK
jgi:hypothetical protein